MFTTSSAVHYVRSEYLTASLTAWNSCKLSEKFIVGNQTAFTCSKLPSSQKRMPLPSSRDALHSSFSYGAASLDMRLGGSTGHPFYSHPEFNALEMNLEGAAWRGGKQIHSLGSHQPLSFPFQLLAS